MSSQEQLRAYLEAGLRAHNLGDIRTAKAAYQHALSVAPDHPDALHFLGVAFLQLGETGPAIDYLERATRKQRANAAVIGNLAQAYFQAQRYDESHANFRKASRLVPRNVQFHVGMGTSLAMQGQLDAAAMVLDRLAKRFPQSALVWFNLGNVARDQWRATEAMESYRTAIALDPHHPDARNNLAEVLHKQLRFEEAEREFRACMLAAPDYLLARCNLASVLMDLGRFAEAESLCREVVERSPGWGQGHTLLGAALGHQGRLLEAIECHRAAAGLAAQDAKVAQNFASALADGGKLSDALRWYARALALNPQLASTHLLLGYALLGQGCFAEGWAEYSHRPWPDMFRGQYPNLALSQTLPDQLNNKHICVMREQGLGDEIFFLRFVPQLHAAGARITYCASNKLRSLLERVPGIAQVLEENTPPLTEADAVILAGDLPHAVSNFPASALPATATATSDVLPEWQEFSQRICVFWPRVTPPLVLSPLAGRIAEARARLAAIGDPPYLGLTWRGGTPPREQRMVIWALHKEIGITDLAAALKDVKGTFIALQRKPEPGELDSLSAALGQQIHDFTDLNDDLEGMLALLALIDEYIGVSNTNMHLRAGVGRAARVLVPRPADWRWMHTGRSSPWFPNFPIYRQSLRGDWHAALGALRLDLAQRWPRRSAIDGDHHAAALVRK